MNIRLSVALWTAVAALATLPALAADPSSGSVATSDSQTHLTRAEYKAAKKTERVNYKAAKKACEAKKGAEERACEKEARATHEKAEADLKMRH